MTSDAITQAIIQDICELDNNPFDGMGDDDVWCSLSDLQVILERNLEDHRTTSLAAQDVTLADELRAEISNLEAALTQIAGSHWERYGIDQTDIEQVPDLSAEEAMNVARDALSNTPAPSLAAQPVSSIDFHQRRGRAADLIDWAINEYDGFMMDDDYDSQQLLDRIAERFRTFRDDNTPTTSLASQDGLVEALEAISAKVLEQADRSHTEDAHNIFSDLYDDIEAALSAIKGDKP